MARVAPCSGGTFDDWSWYCRGGLHGACTQVRVSRAGRLLHPEPAMIHLSLPAGDHHWSVWGQFHCTRQGEDGTIFFKKHRPINIQKLYGACIYSIYIYLYYYISICSIFIQCLTPLESIFYLYSIIQHQAIHLGFCPQAVPGEHVINWKPSTIEWRCCRWLERSHGWLKPMAVYHPRYGASWGSASNNL